MTRLGPPPGYANLYDTGGDGILDLVPPVGVYPYRVEDERLRWNISEYFKRLSALVDSILAHDAEFADVEGPLREFMKGIPADRKLNQRLSDRLEDIRIACEVRKVLQRSGRRHETRRRECANLEAYIRQLGQPY
jgi:hypothetical protein